MQFFPSSFAIMLFDLFPPFSSLQLFFRQFLLSIHLFYVSFHLFHLFPSMFFYRCLQDAAYSCFSLICSKFEYCPRLLTRRNREHLISCSQILCIFSESVVEQTVSSAVICWTTSRGLKETELIDKKAGSLLGIDQGPHL